MNVYNIKSSAEGNCKVEFKMVSRLQFIIFLVNECFKFSYTNIILLLYEVTVLSFETMNRHFIYM